MLVVSWDERLGWNSSPVALCFPNFLKLPVLFHFSRCRISRGREPPTARSCRTNMSDAFSEMFPTNTVVVGPLPSSISFNRRPDSFLGSIGFCATATVVGTRTCRIETQFSASNVPKKQMDETWLKSERVSRIWIKWMTRHFVCSR